MNGGPKRKIGVTNACPSFAGGTPACPSFAGGSRGFALLRAWVPDFVLLNHSLHKPLLSAAVFQITIC
jgi:hypothetical protein